MKLRRRDFIRTGMLAGGAALLGPNLSHAFIQAAPEPVEAGIATISGSDPVRNIPKLIDALGGIGQFVRSGQTVGLLANSPWKNPGYFTQPDVVLAIAKLCKDAGARDLIIFKPVPSGYWEKSKNYSTYESLVAGFRYGSERVETDIPRGKSLKKAEMFSIFTEADVYISIPVAKHHNGVIFSGNLKGLMGVSSSNTNRHMHSPDGQYSYENHEYLAQCIADLNTLRSPDLCLIDAIECAISNGPAGPGDIVKPNKLIASRDPLASDVYAAKLIGFEPADILTFTKAYEHGLGELEPEKLKLVEL